jgi:GntR family transcriptional repressor for pyruvate dehydrogenase complex
MIKIRTSRGRPRELKAAERIARRIVTDLLDQDMTTGDGLPGEAAMLSHYETSRESLREALRLLETQGLISIRRGPGGGPIVGSVDPANLGRTATLYFQTAGATYRELFDAWQIAEVMLTERAARNPDSALRTALMEPYLAAEAEPAADADMYEQLHTSFHSAIAALANNRVLEIAYQLFDPVMTNHVVLGLEDLSPYRQRFEDDHHEIAEAVINGWPRRAADLMEQHTGSVIEVITRKIKYDADRLIDWH